MLIIFNVMGQENIRLARLRRKLSAEQVAERTRILVCPLNWGLGHAARDVPLIRRLLNLGHEVILAGDGATMDLLKAEFPELETRRFRSVVRVRYSMHLPAWLKITLLSPFLLYEVFAEHYSLKRIIRQVRPDVVISDNRYGLWNSRVRSILITHQLSIRLPRFAGFLEYPAYLVLRAFIEKFDRCWIPDFPGETNLSGDLSHRYPLPRNAVFTGAMSRFSEPGQSTLKSLNLLIILSGPEPQRSMLHKIILKQIFSLRYTCVILEGLPGKLKRVDLTSNVTTYSHLPSADLRNLLLSAEHVICRAGYTGIMDLALLQKKALIIPTPGQTEQEYLAGYLASKGMFLTCSQDELDIVAALEDLSDFSPVFKLPEGNFPGEELEKI